MRVNLKKWQDGFVSFEHLSGTPGKPGAKSRMKYQIGKREMELIETITVNNLPQEFSGNYEAKQMINPMTNYFTSPKDNKTTWEAHLEYTQFKGILPKLMAFFMPGVFKKQTQKWLDQFKVFAEQEGGKP